MALTGFTRNGQCVDLNDDAGSHHVCIDMSSNTGGNFWSLGGGLVLVKMPCDGGRGRCFVSTGACASGHLHRTSAPGGWQDPERRVRATNMVALKACRQQAQSDAHIADALACLESKCKVAA